MSKKAVLVVVIACACAALAIYGIPQVKALLKPAHDVTTPAIKSVINYVKTASYAVLFSVVSSVVGVVALVNRSVKNSTKKTWENAQAQINESNAVASQALKEKEDLQTKYDSVTKDYEEYKTQMSSAEEQISTLEGQLTEKDRYITQVTTERNMLEKEIQDLKNIEVKYKVP